MAFYKGHKIEKVLNRADRKFYYRVAGSEKLYNCLQNALNEVDRRTKA